MSWTDQYIGLNERAKKLIEGEPVPVLEEIRRTYPDGRQTNETRQVFESTVKSRVYYTREGAWNPGFLELFAYTFPDGRVLREEVQTEPWSSGPCYLLALKDEQGNWVPESLWTEEEIERQL